MFFLERRGFLLKNLPNKTYLYASLYFCAGLEDKDNELLALEVLHRYVELLDKYFGNVCELDIIFNFEKAYFILDEFLMGGEILETSKLAVAFIKSYLQNNFISFISFLSLRQELCLSERNNKDIENNRE
uniref:Adaptor related protein complex 1 subunit sigma 3 n=1 Tax=Pundamilia nyererei TaxID=303518 RepID=A0A3B4FZR8_9CICH